MSNPLDEFIDSRPKTAAATLPHRGMKKVALPKDFFKGLGGKVVDTAVRAGTTGLLGAGAAGLGLAVQNLYDAATKGRDFRNMLDHNPDLHDHLRDDPKMFNQAFSTLRKVNPMFSRDPLIAGTYMRQMMDSPLTAGGKAVEALSHRQPVSPIFDSFSKGTLSGAAAGMKAPPRGQMQGEMPEDNNP